VFFPRLHSLESKEQQEGHHQTEETHSLGQGESKNGVGEKLLLEGRVPGVADDQGAEDGADTSSGASDTDGGGTGSDELGSRVNVSGGGAGLQSAGVHCRSSGHSLKEIELNIANRIK
jgi:hypothetical protein